MARISPRPFLKWAGGKGQLVSEILAKLPARIPQYVEPFLGGGAVFFALAREGRIERAVLGDRNADLISVWEIVRDDVEALAERVNHWPNDEALYYRIRDEINGGGLSALERAARLLWLNRHCYNGLYRRNSKGHFNVPWGRHTARQRVDVDNLRRCSEILQGVELVSGDFDAVFARVEAGATVYCDPPYAPVSSTANFNNYDGLSFREDDQERLAARFGALAGRGVAAALLSNSDCDLTRRLYEAQPQRMIAHTVRVRRNINRDAAGRAPVNELLVELTVGDPQPGLPM